MICSLILASVLLVVLGFYKLVRLQMAACEAGPAPDSYGLNSSEEWASSIDVALELAWFQSPSAPVVVRKAPKIRKVRPSRFEVPCMPEYFAITSVMVSRPQAVIRGLTC